MTSPVPQSPSRPEPEKNGVISAISGPKHVFSGVFELLDSHLAHLDQFLNAQVEDFEPEIRELVVYAIAASGKRIRPALLFLSGWQGPDLIPAPLVRAAAVVELIHLATLVHDDIMDGADVRRNRETAARKFGSTPAVLLGDALFAHALNLATRFATNEVCAAVSESTRRVCAGEIVQTLRRGSLAVTREDYARIIDLKTAELFRVSCLLGARLVSAPEPYIQAVGQFGRHLGIAYQIYDDLADYYGQADRIGKTLGTDLASGKLTLPLFILLERLGPAEAADLRTEVSGETPPHLDARLRQMRDLGVFEAVQAAVDAELAAARRALEPWQSRPSAAHLLELVRVLQIQVASLR